MPNWCKNVLKVSGDREQMVRFKEDLLSDKGSRTIKRELGPGTLTAKNDSSAEYWFKGRSQLPVMEVTMLSKGTAIRAMKLEDQTR